MSVLLEENQTSPHDPLHYAPRRLRERARTPLSVADKAQSEREAGPGERPIRTSLDTSLENAVFQSLRRPLDPEVMHQPSAVARDRGRRRMLFPAAAVGISALAALLFVLMVREPDAGAFAVQAMKAAQQSNTALSEFRGLLRSPEADQPATHERSDKLLKQFMQWRQKAGSAETSQ
jgi:hypothetical protein